MSKTCPSKGCQAEFSESHYFPGKTFCFSCRKWHGSGSAKISNHVEVPQEEQIKAPIAYAQPDTKNRKRTQKKAKDPQESKLPEERKKALSKMERVCVVCGKIFKRNSQRGRPPTKCPKCRS